MEVSNDKLTVLSQIGFTPQIISLSQKNIHLSKSISGIYIDISRTKNQKDIECSKSSSTQMPSIPISITRHFEKKQPQISRVYFQQENQCQPQPLFSGVNIDLMSLKMTINP